jgi:hypothetical protein
LSASVAESLEEISVAALRKEQLPHPALRATLSRQAGEGKNMDAFAPNGGGGLPRAFGPSQWKGFALLIPERQIS